MFGYKLLKLAIFFIYWLGFAPWLVLILRSEELLSASTLQDIFLKYVTLLFVLILLYILLHQLFDYFYMRHKIKKIVRKVTIRHQLKRLENGEIDLIAAQRLSTFTTYKTTEKEPQKVKRKEPQEVKRKVQSGSKKAVESQKSQKQLSKKPLETLENPECKTLSKVVEIQKQKELIPDIQNQNPQMYIKKTKMNVKNQLPKALEKQECKKLPQDVEIKKELILDIRNMQQYKTITEKNVKSTITETLEKNESKQAVEIPKNKELVLEIENKINKKLETFSLAAVLMRNNKINY